MKQKINGGMVVPRNSVPLTRKYPDKYHALWKRVSLLKRSEVFLVQPGQFGGGINALRCGLRRAKIAGRVPTDLRVHFDGETAHLYRD